MLRTFGLVTGLLGLAGCLDQACPDHYAYREDLDSCYRLIDDDFLSWQEAESSCERADHHGVDAHLAVIDSDLERDAINDGMRDHSSGYWVGASDVATEGSFVLVTGGAMVREDWGGGEPNNDFGSEDCVEYRVGISDLMNDRTCSDAMNWVCEWDGVPAI
jgi:hypothetical protein